MEALEAQGHLQVIRTLMERAVLYRRALAPTALAAGIIGTLAALIGVGCIQGSPGQFIVFWLGAAGVALALAAVIIRRQALREAESFWSLPTRRVVSALWPPLAGGVLSAGALYALPTAGAMLPLILPPVWMVFYGCAMQAAGFFMQRGIRLLGLAFILIGAVWPFVESAMQEWMPPYTIGHSSMGLMFGVGHLAYGAYLRLTEPKADA
ncbi:MAG: hypothetical protein EXS36_00670 [Pedosphaera sp.]|nr:hypothetical protein [Pedosphaera sp.]